MKVLTIREPFATLIMNKIKYIETRSWKTNYRGEIYIHAGVAKLDNKIKDRVNLTKLYNSSELNYGYIICKANLVDCVLIDEEFVNKVKHDSMDNYYAGDYALGRYAWILADVEIIEKIPAKGQLGIWNYK